jgi:hypothetical protein
MKDIIVKEITVEVPAFETTDGRIFKESEKDAAILHQFILDSGNLRKYCPTCNGKKTEYVDKGSWGYYERWEFVECRTCGGRGYLELKYS